MTRWILVRHAQSAANADGVLSGHTDVPLTVVGFQQAMGLAMLLRSERIVRVVSSDLQRAQDTALTAMVGRSNAVRTTPALRERHLGAWTGKTYRDLQRAGVRHLLDDYDHRPPGGGESLRDVARRAIGHLDAIDDGRPTLVVAHGGLLRAILGVLDGLPASHIGLRQVPNAVPLIRELPEGTWGRLHAEDR